MLHESLRFYVFDNLVEVCSSDCNSHGGQEGFSVAMIVSHNRVLGPYGISFLDLADKRIKILDEDDAGSPDEDFPF